MYVQLVEKRRETTENVLLSFLEDSVNWLNKRLEIDQANNKFLLNGKFRTKVMAS